MDKAEVQVNTAYHLQINGKQRLISIVRMSASLVIYCFINERGRYEEALITWDQLLPNLTLYVPPVPPP